MTKDIQTSSDELDGPRLAPMQVQSLAEQIADTIVKAAVEGVLKQGDRLMEVELSQQLGVSRVPVREALKLLQGRGIVVAMPNRGMRLATFDAIQLKQILAVRSRLERLAIDEIAAGGEALLAEAVAAMSAALDGMKRAARERDSYAVARADLDFHRAMIVGSGNPITLQFWDSLATRLTIMIGVACADTNLVRVCQDHAEILENLKKADFEAAQAAVDDNIFERRIPVDQSALARAQRQRARQG